MSFGYKAKTNDVRVAIRDAASTSGTVVTRISNGRDIEVGTSIIKDSTANTWRKVAYGYKNIGYMMTNFISIKSRTSNKYYMIEALEAFGTKLYVRGDSDLRADSGEIHNIQNALNTLCNNYVSKNPKRPLKRVDSDGIFGGNTQTAVENAQDFMGCDVDGKVGPQTKARLYYLAYGKGGWPLAETAN